MPLQALYVPHGPEEGAGRYVAPLPRRHAEGMGNYLSNLYIRQDVTDLQDFANILRSELDGAHYLNDGHHVQMLGRIDELSVQFNLLRAEHAHYVDEHWIPMQQFARGVPSAMAILADTSPESPAFCRVCGGGNAPSGPSDEPQPSYSPPVGLVSNDLSAFGIYNSPQQSSHSLSIPGLESVTSSSVSSVLYSPSSSYVDVINGRPSSPALSFHEGLMHAIIWSDYLHYRREEAFVSAGEQGESETLHSTEGNASGSSAASEDVSEEILAAEAGRVQDDNGAGSVPLYSV